MASTKAYLDYVLEQLSGLEEISYRAMMGEYQEAAGRPHGASLRGSEGNASGRGC